MDGRWMEGWMDGWVGGLMDGWMDGRMDGWVDGFRFELIAQARENYRGKGQPANPCYDLTCISVITHLSFPLSPLSLLPDLLF
jgi:hypothetical protein